MKQHGLLRALGAAELSDGTLRYLLWIAALLTPRPPALMVLNEPETSLHPDLLAPLARLITQASKRIQVIVVTHAASLITALREQSACHSITLEKTFGETSIAGMTKIHLPVWSWPTRKLLIFGIWPFAVFRGIPSGRASRGDKKDIAERSAFSRAHRI